MIAAWGDGAGDDRTRRTHGHRPGTRSRSVATATCSTGVAPWTRRDRSRQRSPLSAGSRVRAGDVLWSSAQSRRRRPRRGARHLAESMPAPSALVILEPSGWDAVTIGYKGSLRLRASVDQPHAHGAGARSERARPLLRPDPRAPGSRRRTATATPGSSTASMCACSRFASTSDGLDRSGERGHRCSHPAGVRRRCAARHRAIVGARRRADASSAANRVSAPTVAVRSARGFVRAIRADGRCTAIQAQDRDVRPQHPGPRVGLSGRRVRARRLAPRPHAARAHLDRGAGARGVRCSSVALGAG